MKASGRKKTEYGLIGEQLSHSFSREIHESFADYDYSLIELKKNELEGFFKERNFKGINVTIPYKQAAMEFLDDISEEAESIGAVNTIVNDEGLLRGYNTDYFGLKELIKKSAIEVQGKVAMILGTGGTSNTAEAVLKSLGAGSIVKVSRKNIYGNTLQKEKSLPETKTLTNGENNVSETAFDSMSSFCKIISYEEASALTETEIIINTTPCGMFPQTEEMPIDIGCFPSLCGVIDVIYNPINTRLILEAKKRNIPCGGGLYMLAAQAVKSSVLFTMEHLEKGNASPAGYEGNDITDAKNDTENYASKGTKSGAKNDTENDTINGTINDTYEKILAAKQNIVLTGMPGCGKSTLGKCLSEMLQKEFVDVDLEIEKECGRTPAEIIRTDGEEAFRKAETETIRRISKRQGLVIAPGGGAVLSGENIDLLKQNGKVLFLDKKIEEIDISKDRPLSNDKESLKKIFSERIDIYRKSADIIVPLFGDIENCSRLLYEKCKAF